MKINYGLTGKERKALVAAISQELNTEEKYLGMPTAAYTVGDYTVDKTGTVTGPDNRGLVANLSGLHSLTAVSEEYDTLETVTEETPAFESLNLTEGEELGLGRERRDYPGEDGMQASDVPEDETDNPYPAGSADSFYAPGYVPKYRAELSDPDSPERMEVFLADNDTEAIRLAREYCTGEIRLLELHEVDYESYESIRSVDLTHADRFTIEMPKTGFTETAIDNLIKLVESKAGLIKKAVGAESLPVEETEETLRFPWFSADITPDEVSAYSHLIAALCKMAKEQKRITAKEKKVDNEKYAFRCFLLRLGFIGDDTKQARKLLLSRMDGNGSFKSGERKPTETAEPEKPAGGTAAETDMNSLAETLADAELVHAVNASFETESGDNHE